MHIKPFPTLHLIAMCAAITTSFPTLSADPFNTETLIPSQPGIIWQAPALLNLDNAEPKRPLLPTGALSLAELTDLALLNNPSSREAWFAARADAASLGISQSALLPSLDATLSISRGKYTSNNNTGNTQSGSGTRFSPGLGLNYVLFDFGARSATEQAARYALLATNLNQNRTLQSIVLRVEQAYYQFMGSSLIIEAAREAFTNAQTSSSAVDAKRKAGLATIGEVYQADTALGQARLQLARVQGEANKFKGELAVAVGLPVNSVLNLAPLPSQPPLKETKQNVDRYLAQAKLQRPDILAAEAQTRSARARVDAVTAQGKPNVELAANIGATYSSGDSGNIARSNNVGVNVRIPLFNGFRTEYAIKEAQARVDQLQATHERISQQVELDVWKAYYDLETSVIAIDSARALLKSARQSREVAQARYQAGVGTLLDLLSAQTAEANARVENIQSELGWYSALSRLNNAMGVFSSNQQSAS